MYYFSSFAYCADLDGGAVILDLRHDTYLGIDSRFVPALRAAILNWPNSSKSMVKIDPANKLTSERLLEDLLRREVVTPSPTCDRIDCVPAARETIHLGQSICGPTRVRLGEVVHFIGSLLKVLIENRRGPVMLVDWLRVRQQELHKSPLANADTAKPLLASFFRLRMFFYTAHRRCLVDSLALSVYLTKSGIPCTFVIGVSLKPFAAHSWVQMNEMVLNDTAEHVQTFTPILAIGRSE
jgi:hypothetical protein